MIRSYFGGILAGIGLCGIGMKYLDRGHGVSVMKEPLWLIGGILLVVVGSFLARSSQRRIEHRRPQYVPEDHRL
jgi:hypothetical protein